MSKKYTSRHKKEDILVAIMEEFEEVCAAYNRNVNDFNCGRYIAMMDLLKKVEIFEKEEEGDSK